MNNRIVKCVMVAVSLSAFQSLFTSCKEARGSKEEVAVISTDKACIGIADDAVLTEGVKLAIKDYPGVNAEIESGEIVLTGSIDSAHHGELMTTLRALRATRITNRLSLR